MITQLRANLKAARDVGGSRLFDDTPPSSAQYDQTDGNQNSDQASGTVPGLDFSSIQANAKQVTATNNGTAMRAALDALNVAEDQHGETVVTIKSGRRFETVPIMSAAGNDIIARVILDATNRMPGKDTIAREAGRLRMAAREAGRKCKTYIRVAAVGGGYAIDLGDDDGHYISILPGQVSIEANDGSIRFKRGRGYGAFPMPVLSACIADALARMRAEVSAWGCPSSKQDMLVAALLESWRPDTPYPVLQLVGAAGRGKTTAARCAARCIDPSTSGMPPEVAIDAEEIVAAAANTHVITTDNRSKLTPEQQNLVCQIATGAEITLREFYGQTNTLRVAIARPLIITAIHHVLTAPDAADRSVSIEIAPPRQGYTAAASIMAQFEQRLPQIVGDLAMLLAAVLKKLPAVASQRQWQHRMVEFAQTGEAMTQAAGGPVGGFIAGLEMARRAGARDYAEGDVFLQALLKFLHAEGSKVPKGSTLAPARGWRDAPGWTAANTGHGIVIAGRAGALRGLLCMPTYSYDFCTPKSDREFAGALIRVTPTLAALGITLNERTSGGRKIFIFTFPLSAAVL